MTRCGRRRRGIPGSPPTFLDHGHQQAVCAVVSAGAPASQRVSAAGWAGNRLVERMMIGSGQRWPIAVELVGLVVPELVPRPARSCGPPGAWWPSRARWRAATVSCRSSRYARTGRTGAGETTILQWPRTRRSRSRLGTMAGSTPGKVLTLAPILAAAGGGASPASTEPPSDPPATGPHGRRMNALQSGGTVGQACSPRHRLRDRCSSSRPSLPPVRVDQPSRIRATEALTASVSKAAGS